MQAVYRFDRYPASFNFLEFLVAAKTYGATEIVLDVSHGHTLKYTLKETEQRVKSIVEPCCALAGLPFVYGKTAPGMIDCGYHFAVPVKAWKDCGWLAKLKSVKPSKVVQYTVTLRNSTRQPRRNSNTTAWRRFAEEIGAKVFEDWSDEPIHLHDRMAYYAGAEMNFFSNGGMSALGIFSDYPYTILMNKAYNPYLDANGWKRGDQIPWALPNQTTVWEEDTYENLMHALTFQGSNHAESTV